jgi:hypothetical protein
MVIDPMFPSIQTIVPFTTFWFLTIVSFVIVIARPLLAKPILILLERLEEAHRCTNNLCDRFFLRRRCYYCIRQVGIRHWIGSALAAPLGASWNQNSRRGGAKRPVYPRGLQPMDRT